MLEGAAGIIALSPSFLPQAKKLRQEATCLSLGSLLAPGAGPWLLWNIPAPRGPSDPEENSSRVYSKLTPVESCL